MSTTTNQNPPAESAENTSSTEASKDTAKKYDKEELLKVFDELLFNGEYREEFLVRGKLAVTFRTRSTKEAMEMSRNLDKGTFNLITTLQQERAYQALIYSLVEYQGRDLSGLSKDDKAKFVDGLPLNIVDSLSDLLSEFDNKVMEACKEGEKNF